MRYSFFTDCIILVLLFFNTVFAFDAEELLKRVENNQKRVISDQDFFGQYNLDNGSWNNRPILDYSYSRKLRAVEYCAKKGDYESAANELLKYYRSRDFKRQKISSSWNQTRVDFLMDNIIGFDQQEKVAAVFEIKDQPAEYILDVGGFIRRGDVVFMLMGRHKNESASFVNSRESVSNKPVLELLIDKEWVSVTASADVYVRAGKFKNDNYGKEELLRICNSGLKTNKPFDDNTSRALISFDLSKVPVEKAEKARLKIYAYSQKNEDSLILWRSYPTIVNEDEDNWGNMLGYQYSWEGLDGDIEWGRPEGAHSQYPNWVRRLYWLGDISRCAVTDGDNEVGEKVISMLRDFIEEYNYQSRANGELNAGLGRLTGLSTYLPYLFDLDVMTGRDCTEIMKFLCKEGEYMWLNPSKLRRNNYDNMGLSLISSITTLCLTFPELADSNLWKEDAFARAEDLMDHLVLADGSYTEHTMGYPFPVLQMMLDLLDYCKDHNASLPESFSRKTHQLAKYLMNVSMPDGVPVAWGEGGPRDTKTNAAVKRAAEFFDDEQLQWWCGLTKNDYAPKYTSLNYPDAKIVMLRSGWDENAIAIFVSPRVGGGHYHVDQNHISLSAYGRKLLVDTGMSSYSGSHPHFDWQRHQTKSHNTVEVDEKGFPRLEMPGATMSPEGDCKSELYLSEKVEYFKGYAAGYPTVLHNRSVMYLKEPGLFIVADLMQPSDDIEHAYNQCWHLSPLLDYEVDGARVSTTDSGVGIEIVSLYPQDAKCFVRDGFNANPLGDTKYPCFRQKSAGQARFYTLLYPKKDAGKSDVEITLLEESEEAIAFEIQLPQGKGVYLHNTNPANAINVSNLSIKAEFAYIQFDVGEKIDYAMVLNGEELIFGGKEVDFVELKGYGNGKK
ncbi:MAG: heparinase II/III family protein [Sedimentisphaeraceae bacterium JB056]